MYLGAAVGVTAAGVVFGSPSVPGTRIVVDLVISAVLLAAGWVTITLDDGSARVRSVLWFLAMFSLTGLVVEVFGTEAGLRGRSLVAVAGATVSLSAAVLWWFSRRSLQLIALFVASLVTVDALLFPFPAIGLNLVRPSFTSVAIFTWFFGALWILAGFVGLVRPRGTALVLGALAAISGPWLVQLTPDQVGGRIVSLVSAVVVLAVGELRSERALAGVGIAGTLIVSSVIVSSGGTEQGPAIVMLVVGSALLGIGLALIRLAGAPARVEPPRPDEPPPTLAG